MVTRLAGRSLRLLSLGLALAALTGSQARAGYNDLLATNITGQNITQYDKVTGALLAPTISTGAEYPTGLTIGGDNNLYVANLSGSVQKYDGTTGAFLGNFVTAGSTAMTQAHSVVFGPSGNLFVSSLDTNAVYQFNGLTGAPVGPGGVFATAPALVQPTGLAFGPDGNLYVSNSAGGTNSILKFDGATGAFLSTFASVGVSKPAGLTFAPDGTLFVANFGANNVLRYSLGGVLLATISSSLTTPSSVAFDGLGHMFVSNNGPNQIIRFDADFVGNSFTNPTLFATSGLNGPITLALRPVPEPSALALLGLGAGGLIGWAARRRLRDRA